MKRAAVIVVLLALVALTTSGAIVALTSDHHSGGAASSGPRPVVPADDGTAATPPSPALARFYGQTLRWSACENDDQCATLTVPLDYLQPAGRTIDLSVLKVPASGDRIGSLVVNPGGPGAPGTTYAAYGGQAFGEPLLQHFDIVGFDPRGTGGSDPVDCLSDSQLDSYLAGDPAPSTPAEVASYKTEQRALAAGCPRLSGDLASHISTVESARDMDILRAALDESTLNYLGASYGTQLGATYAQLFPTRVGRFVLDGAVDVSLSGRQLVLQQAAGFQTALDAYVSSCVGSASGCFLGDTNAEAEHTIARLVASVARKPLPVSDGRTLQAGNAFSGIVAALYSRATWLLLSTSLRAALGGDGSGLMQLSDLYAHRQSDGTYADNTMEAFFAISCLDDPASIPFRKVSAQYPAFEKASPVFGKEFAWGLTSCHGYTPRSDQAVPTIHAKGAPPIVVVGTTRDPATPYAWAKALSRELDSGVLVTRDGDGHTGYHVGNVCVDDAVESFLVSDVVPPVGTTC